MFFGYLPLSRMKSNRTTMDSLEFPEFNIFNINEDVTLKGEENFTLFNMDNDDFVIKDLEVSFLPFKAILEFCNY